MVDFEDSVLSDHCGRTLWLAVHFSLEHKLGKVARTILLF